MQSRKKPARPKRPVTNKNCYFCDNKKTPNYLEVEELKRFITERGRILNRSYSGVCSKHQKKLAIAVKRARHLGLLPFKGGLS